MKLLFIGDSIIRGTQGVNFVQRLARRHPDWQITNAGENGEPLRSIGKRLVQHLQRNADYDMLVLQAGYNDVLLPAFADKGFWFQQALAHKLNQGHQPLASVAAFEQELRYTVEWAQIYSTAKVVLLTLGCLNEDLSAPLNKQRNRLNAAIRRVAQDYGCALADVGTSIDEALEYREANNYCLESFPQTALGDFVQCYLGRADTLSRQRQLQLTIDGVHLNSHGAELFAQAVEKCLLASAQAQTSVPQAELSTEVA